MTELPENWSKVPLLTVSDLVRGVTYSKGDAQLEPFDGSIPVLRANNIQDRGFRLTDLVHVPESLVAEKQHVGSGDVVVATSSGSISVVGKAAQALENMNVGFGAFCGLLRPNIVIHAPYFGFFFSSDDYRKAVSSMARGVNINNLKREHFESLELPLAPLAEQKRIADKLEAVLGRVDACRARLDRVPALLKRFRQSVLAAATSGKLTEEWRENANGMSEPCRGSKTSDFGGFPPEWRVAALGTLVQNHDNKRIPIKASDRSRRSGVFPYYGAFGIIDTIDEFLYDGEYVLLAEDGKNLESRDRPIALIASGKFWVNNHAHVLQPKEELCIGYLHFSLNSPALEIDSLLTGIDQIKLTRKAMDRIQINVPPVPEQQEIVRRVKDLFAFADRIEARLATAQKAVERLTPATLAKAFRGEMVPQDPTDEPASALLERLRSQSASVPPKPARKTRAKRP